MNSAKKYSLQFWANKLFCPTAKIFVLVFAVSFLFASELWAYPDFIGYGYSSCITCHYNGLGGGALNDYGRALFASEVTARDVYPKEMEDEEIAASSGFLGSTQMPWWIRAGAKYRGLWLQANPNSAQTVEKFINMQEDLNLNLFADKKQNLAVITTLSYTDNYQPHSENKKWEFYLKESYLRWKLNNNLWLYAGQLEKAYGIRNIDHTAVNRSINNTGTLGQFDQSAGAIVHLTYPTWDLALNSFFGNTYDSEANKQKGSSATGELQVAEKVKLGASLLQSENETLGLNLMSLSSRMGLTKGSSFLAEVGLKRQNNKTDGSHLDGYYLWLESLISLRRGYNLLTVVESTKRDLNSVSPENLKLSFGAMLFPLPRTEFRFMAVNAKSYQDGSGHYDNWTLQSQLHISY